MEAIILESLYVGNASPAVFGASSAKARKELKRRRNKNHHGFNQENVSVANPPHGLSDSKLWRNPCQKCNDTNSFSMAKGEHCVPHTSRHALLIQQLTPSESALAAVALRMPAWLKCRAEHCMPLKVGSTTHLGKWLKHPILEMKETPSNDSKSLLNTLYPQVSSLENHCTRSQSAGELQ